MTSTSSVDIVATPCCGARYKKNRFASFHIKNQHVWSDGFWINDGHNFPRTPVCQCQCGQLFMAASVDTVDSVSFSAEGWQSDLKRLNVDALSSLPTLTRLQAYELIDSGAPMPDARIALEVRKTYWHLLNDRYRLVTADLKTKRESPSGFSWSALSDAEMDERIQANLLALIPMLKAEGTVNHLLVGEGYRQLGQMKPAMAHFRQAMTGRNEEYDRALEHLIRLAEEGQQRVICTTPPDWSEPPRKLPIHYNTRRLWGPVVTLTSEDYWFQIFGMLQQSWALIEPCKEGQGVMLYRIEDDSGIYLARRYDNEDLARDALRADGWTRFEDSPDVWDFIQRPGPVFYISQMPADKKETAELAVQAGHAESTAFKEILK